MIRSVLVRSAVAMSQLASWRAHRQLMADLDDPAAAQSRTLRQIVQGLSQTEYGRRCGLTAGAAYEEFARTVPIVPYEDLSDDIARIKSGARNVLWPGVPKTWRQTSGSSGAGKDIPVSAALNRVFSRYFLAWSHDVLQHSIRLRSGKLFMSLSPLNGPGQALLDDAGYVGGPVGWLIRKFLVAPEILAACRSPQTFRLFLATALVAEERLEIVSIWNPTYLLVLLDTIHAEQETIQRAFRQGKLAIDGLRLRLPPLDSAREIALNTGDWPRLWPELKLISCWTDAAAQTPACDLARQFPGIELQSKGLLSTEAPVSLPLAGALDPVAYGDGVLLEFVDDQGRVWPLADVKAGQEYQLVVSMVGGFPRYDLGDRVCVTGFHRRMPTLRFAGRAHATSDLVGEKLQETFVGEAFRRSIGSRRACLLPVMIGTAPYHYVLAAQGVNAAMAVAVDEALQRAMRYREARHCGQLACVAPLDVPNFRSQLTQAMEAGGQSWGDIKDPVLVTDPGKAGLILARLKAAAPPSRPLTAVRTD